CYQYFCGYSF
nr:immunoglobulin light chain junction region [Macaca mulatta]